MTLNDIPAAVISFGILPYLSPRQLLNLLVTKTNFWPLIIVALEQHDFFIVPCMSSDLLTTAVSQVKAIRKILHLTTITPSTIVVVAPEDQHRALPVATGEDAVREVVVIDFSGITIVGRTTHSSKDKSVTIHQRIHVNKGATHVIFRDITIANNCNKSLTRSSIFNSSGITVSNLGTSLTMERCCVHNMQANSCVHSAAHGLVVTDGAHATAVKCQFHDNEKSGIFVRGVGSRLTIVDGACANNQDYGAQVERGGTVTLFGKTKIHHNNWYGLGAYGRGSTITIGSRECIIAENTNDSYGSKYGYSKEGGIIQLLCE
jgi:hypothetical protein